MSPDALDRAAEEVLRRFPPCGDEPIALGNAGGFSGARLWRVGDRCLRAWPPDDSFPVRLDHIHQLMTQARESGLTFVPRLERTADASSRVEHRGRWWELAEWLPGRADYHERPSNARLEAACVGLAQLHIAWGRGRLATGPCPAVARRFDSLGAWQRLRDSGWDVRSVIDKSDPLTPLIGRAADLLAHWLGPARARLGAWALPQLPLQPCLCDIWHDNILFEGDRLTGFVDYGSVKADHVAVDLARMLGSLVADDEDGWLLGLAAYRRVRPLSAEEADLARALDRTGTVLGVANWLRWLFVDRREFADRAAVGRRLGTLVARVETW